MMYRFGPSICSSQLASSEREWMLADGLGGYAMGTVGGIRTRRSQGLLVVGGGAGSEPHLGLAAVDLTVVVGDHRYALSAHQTGSGVEPQGFRNLTRFDIVDGLPRWYWAVADVVVSLQVAMTYGRSGVGLVYRVEQAAAPVSLVLEPLVTWRPYNGERWLGNEMPTLAHDEQGVSVDGQFRITGSHWLASPDWRRDLRYSSEEQRSSAASEDLTCPGRFEATLMAGDSTELVAWSGDLLDPPPAASDIVLAAQLRARRLASQAGCYDDIDRSLVLSADQFIGVSPGVIAGYPGCAQRWRDTLIGYRGLFLETGRAHEGRDLLLKAIAGVEGAALPESASHDVPSADAVLWLFQAILHHVDATADLDLASAAVPVMAQAINALVGGTCPGVAVDPSDGLLMVAPSDWPRTWMDARSDDQPVTPRTGKPVELNALWLSGLGITRALAGRLGKVLPGARLDNTARQAFARFGGIGGGFADVIDGPAGDDPSLRPNQLFAVTLPFPASSNAGGVLDAVAPLVTPFGLRTLAPGEPDYRTTRAGTMDDHWGTVWLWLIGPYADAIRISGRAIPGVLSGLEDHVPLFGVGSISAMLDGSAPHHPTGYPFHALGVAEMLRVRHSLR